MDSDLAASSHAQPQPHSQDHMQLDAPPPAAPLINGNYGLDAKDTSNISEAINHDAFTGNSNLSAERSTLESHDATSLSTSLPEPSEPTPVDSLPAINPVVADIAAKDPPTNSHPTPPPEPPLNTSSDANPDTDMSNAEAEQPQPTEPSAPLSTENSLVRPREDDDEEQRAAKRAKTEAESGSEPAAPEVRDPVVTPDHTSFAPNPPAAEPEAPPSASPSAPPAEPQTQSIAPTPAEPASSLPPLEAPQAIQTPATEPVIAPVAEPVPQPIAALPEQSSTEEKTEVAQANPEPSVSQTLADEDSIKVEPATHTPAQPVEADVKPSVEVAPSAQVPAVPQAPATTLESAMYSTGPITPAQKLYLVDKWKNIKKTKHAICFLKPVDWAALNIPNYPEIIKNPMDLTTMEHKLKEDKYASVQDFANDFLLIGNNCRTFNGPNHAITQAGESMKAYFDKFMDSVPRADQPLPSKGTKKRSPSIGKPQPRREARNIPVAPPAPGPDTFALRADGTPQIRRDSNINQRPARAIKPPPNRELTYAKPKRKEHQLELKFCEYVLDEIRGPRYGQSNHLFLAPVDPVALNIPHYRQVIKTPMDLGTMTQKLKQGQYGKASEVKKDFELIVANCLLFNPVGNPVRDLGIQLQRDFNSLWSQKEKWERANKPESQRASSDEESGAEEEEEEDDHDDAKERTIEALQKQLETMQNMIVGLTGGKAPKGSKKSSKKSGSKKVGSLSSVPSKSKPSTSKPKITKKVKQVTYEEKQEISEAVNRMNESQVGELTTIITANCEKYRDQDEMELEIDDLPNHVQALLLSYVRRLFGNPNKKARAVSPDDVAAVDDDDFEPRARNSGGGNKRKKHKPMGKHEQGETIKELQSRLAQFNGGGGHSSESPTNRHPDTSGDDESEESEEE